MVYYSSISSLIYNCWLNEFCRKYPKIDRDRIVFDNQTAVFTYNQELPDVKEIVSDTVSLVLSTYEIYDL